MKISVRLFAGHRERMGTSQTEVDVPDGGTVGDVFQLLTVRAPSLAETESFTTFALNRQVVPPETLVREGDEVALLQPVSGG